MTCILVFGDPLAAAAAASDWERDEVLEGVGDELDAEEGSRRQESDRRVQDRVRSEFSFSGDGQWLVKTDLGEEEVRPCKSSVSLMMF